MHFIFTSVSAVWPPCSFYLWKPCFFSLLHGPCVTRHQNNALMAPSLTNALKSVPSAWSPFLFKLWNQVNKAGKLWKRHHAFLSTHSSFSPLILLSPRYSTQTYFSSFLPQYNSIQGDGYMWTHAFIRYVQTGILVLLSQDPTPLSVMNKIDHSLEEQ